MLLIFIGHLPSDTKTGIKSRTTFLKALYVFIILLSLSSTASVAGLLLLFPDFPPHFRTVFNFNSLLSCSSSNNNLAYTVCTRLLRIIFDIGLFIIEVYEQFITWSVLESVDTLLIMLCRSVTTTLRRMKHMLLENSKTNLPDLCFLYRQ